jgi:DNA polymerase V
MYAHIDCNNFFVSCERLFRPELEKRPVAVLSNNDGCLISRSQEVKDLGIAMGVPLFKVKPLVKTHDITLFSGNFALYGEISERIVVVLREITPLIEVYSIDESFLDLSELQIEDMETWGKELRARIVREIGVPVSVGIGPTKTLAKVATTYAKKHDGVMAITDEAKRQALLTALPVEDVWGVGWRTAPKLKERGVSNAWQLVSASDAWLKTQFTVSGLKMVDELRGVPRHQFGDKHETRKSIMVSRSFGHKIREYHQLEGAASNFAVRAAAKLRRQGSVCSTVVVYLTTSRFDEQVRRVAKQVHLPEATADTGTLITAALGVLEQLYDPDFSYQKVAVILLDIVQRSEWQLSLTNPDRKREQKQTLMQQIDTLNQKYGADTVWYGAEDKRHAAWHSRSTLCSPAYTSRWSDLPLLR